MKILAGIRQGGVTVLLLDQDAHLALSNADRGYVIEMGAAVHGGPVDVLFDDPLVRKAYL